MDGLEYYIQKHLMFDIRVPFILGAMRVFELVEKPRSSVGFSMKDQFSRTFSIQVFSIQKPLQVAGHENVSVSSGSWSSF